MSESTVTVTGSEAGAARFRGRRVLVTGGSGFIGSAVAERLVRIGAEVLMVSRRTPHAVAPGARSAAVDLSDEAALRRAYQEFAPELVFHLAGYAYGSRGLEHVWPAFTGNLVSTIHLLTLATEAGGTPVILAGSQEEPWPHDGPAATYVPNSPYGASKFAGSAYARMFHHLYQLPVTIARIVTVYGPGQREYKKLVPYVILSFLRGEAPRLSSAKRVMDWVYIDDVVDGLLAIASGPNLTGRMVDIGTGAAYSVRATVEIIATFLRPATAPVFGAREDRALEDAVKADAATTRDQLGWVARVSLEEGLRRTIAWYRDELAAGRIQES